MPGLATLVESTWLVAAPVTAADVVAMTLKRLSRDQVHALRLALEISLEEAVGQEIRAWLADVKAAALRAVDGPTVLLAAAGDEMPGMGTIAGWWSQRVDDSIQGAVRAALYRAYNRWTDQSIEASPAMEATNTYLSQVRDRLVLGTHFGVTVYGDSYDRIREALAISASEGWSRQQLSQQIAAELSWEKDGAYWRTQLAKTDSIIDSILDPLGEPGTALREYTKANDPRVRLLRQFRNTAISHLDAERSVWQTRAMLIARTEATGGANFGAYQALIAEGVKTKVWDAAGDSRTRPSHRNASGQEVPIQGMFLVGTSLMRFPGDPAGPVTEVANCRCAMIGG